MSADLQLSAVSESVDFPYKAVSRGAISSIIFFVLALPGLLPTFWVMLVLAIPGILFAAMALRSIAKYPEEFSGRSLAMAGLIGCSVLLLGGVAYHTYVYYTEVPDGYTRVEFFKLQAGDNSPDVPTELAIEIDGNPVFLKGYIHPSSGSGMLRQFILVPDLGTCCFGGQPKSTDMLEVTLPAGSSVRAGMTKRKLAGTFQVNRVRQQKTDFDNPLFYKIRVDQYK